MQNKHQPPTDTDLSNTELTKYYENLISYIRSRLNIIGTSVYLLQADWRDWGFADTKYFKKINEELESIRKLINN